MVFQPELMRWWLGVVGGAAIASSVQNYLAPDTTRTKLFDSGVRGGVSDFGCRMFAAWTALAGAVRLACAVEPASTALYDVTLGSFALVIGVFGAELRAFGTTTTAAPGLRAAAVVSVTSLVWMLANRGYFAAAAVA